VILTRGISSSCVLGSDHSRYDEYEDYIPIPFFKV
jgi:hypothetical protein